MERNIQTYRMFEWLVVVFVIAMMFPAMTHAATVVYLTSGTTWSVPGDWNSSSNTIEVIGGGGSGGAADSQSTDLGAGGGGGGYSKATNVSLTPGGSVSYQVGSGGAQVGSSVGIVQAGNAGGDTYLCNSTSNCASISGTAVQVGAKGGGGGGASGGAGTASGGTGGQASSGVGSVKYSGGNGGSSSGSGVIGTGAGGGGAAGPNGNGNGGTSTTGSNQTATGGSADAGYGGAGGANSSTGGAGTEWDATHGSGGGGGGVYGGYGGAGGLYGGGSAGGTGGGGGAGSYAAAKGIIVITYTPVPFAHSTITLTGNVKFLGNLAITGALSKGSGTFEIDHPLDPKNSLLFHSFVESPDAKNMYNGTATLDTNGEAVISLPDYFDALNKNVRYQFFPLKQAMPNLYIKEEEKNNRFVIGGGVPGGKVSWQVTGVRHDPYILAHPIIVEVLKGPGQPVKRGECLYEPLCQ